MAGPVMHETAIAAATGAATVLLVDDDPSVLQAIARTLAMDGHRILSCAVPTEALAVLQRERVDVVISDLDMPGMSGVELLGRVRRAQPHVVRILLTARASVAAAVQAINEGEVFRFLTKPWVPAELRATVRAAIARGAAARREEAPAAVSERRRALLAGLEAAHPGVTHAPGTGQHRIDPQRLAAIAERLPFPIPGAARPRGRGT